MEVHHAVIIHISESSKWVIERQFDGKVRIEQHIFSEPHQSWTCQVWVTFDAATWDRIVAAMADSSSDTEVILHG